MALEKQMVIDQITVAENGVVFYRTATRIVEDGNVISHSYHRSTLTPGQSLDGVPANVSAICNVVWTPAVIEAYNAAVAAQGV